jgi:hypothetical protein
VGINIDLSKAFHPRVLDVLTGFMPGLFFETCVLFGNPHLINSLTKAASDRSTSLIAAVVIAFVIGTSFMMWVGLIQWTVNILCIVWYGITRPRRKTLLAFLLKARGTPPRQHWLAKSQLVQRACRRAWNDGKFQEAARAWQRVAQRVLEHYQIEPPDGGSGAAWMPWTSIIGGFEPEDLRGSLLTLTFHATGWSGLAAIHFAPALYAPYFRAFCFFLSDWAYFIPCEWG